MIDSQPEALQLCFYTVSKSAPWARCFAVAGSAYKQGALVLQGTLLMDYGTDLGSGASVKGDPAGVRGKPGKGFGYGAGIRLATPVGPLRFECAWNKDGARRFHFGLGSHG